MKRISGVDKYVDMSEAGNDQMNRELSTSLTEPPKSPNELGLKQLFTGPEVNVVLQLKDSYETEIKTLSSKLRAYERHNTSHNEHCAEEEGFVATCIKLHKPCLNCGITTYTVQLLRDAHEQLWDGDDSHDHWCECDRCAACYCDDCIESTRQGGDEDGPGNSTLMHWVIRCGICLLYTSPSPRDRTRSRMPSSA